MLYLSIFLSTFLTFATPTRSLVDYLKGTPAYVRGSISLDTVLPLYRGKRGIFPVSMQANANRSIGYSFSEKHLRIGTEAGLTLRFAGVPIKVTEIFYHDETGKFEVRTETPLGIGQEKLNQEIAAFLNQYYKPKVLRAFQQLKSLRSAKNLQDTNRVISTISAIFSEGATSTPPTIRGEMNLVFTPLRNRDLKLDQWTAKIKNGDNISMGMKFVKSPGAMKIVGAEFQSTQGIRIHGKTEFPEIASLNFRYARADDAGVNFNYDIGAEEVVGGFMLLMNVVQMYSGHPGSLLQECDPIRLNYIRSKIDGNLRAEISRMIRTHRADLLRAGASRELLAALD